MATPFSVIYDRAVFRFADYKFLEQNIYTREKILEKYLVSAKTDFQRVCKVDWTNDFDKENEVFETELDDDAIEILALGVAFYWLSQKAMNSELLKNVLAGKDYKFYSPANLLKEIQSLRKTIYDEYQSRLRAYSYSNSNIGNLKN